MVHFCIFGGHEGQLSGDKRVYITVFGGCELKQPTLAKRIMERRRSQAVGLPTSRNSFFITLFGGTSIKIPTLAEEFLDLRDALRSGLLTMEDWDSAMAQVGTESLSLGSFTAFGGFGEELPSEEEEVEGLALNRHLGHISDSAGRTLEFGVGRSGSHRAAILRRALSDQGAIPATA